MGKSGDKLSLEIQGTAGEVAWVSAPASQNALAVLAAGSRTFSFAGYFLPRKTRADAALLYAFCRYVDDVADQAPHADAARAALDAVEAVLLGQVKAEGWLSDIMRLFARRQIDAHAAVHLVRGVRSDLGLVRMDTDAALLRYAYAVASTVGIMMCGVLGVKARSALPFAVDLGIAMQLTNICRDVHEDALLGRVYLPASRVAPADAVASPARVLESPHEVSAAVAGLLDMADRYYESAEHGLRYLPWAARLGILVAARTYREIGVKLRANHCDALAGRTVVSTSRKVFVAVQALFAWPMLRWRRASHCAKLHKSLDGLPGIDPSI